MEKPTERAPWHDVSTDVDDYRAWLTRRLEDRQRGAMEHREETSPVRPTLISVVVPVYRPQMWFLKRCVDSIRAQTYSDWELCICDDASGDPEITSYLESLPKLDHRIKLASHRTNGGIAKASNTALELASGEFVAFVDHDDELTADALFLMAGAITDETDVIYSDEDRLDGSGDPCFPHFKPDWSPDLLVAFPYLGHLLAIRRSLVVDLGGFRAEMDGSQDFDLMLRATERARLVVHVAEVLYHWRIVEGSTAGDAAAKPWAHDASRRALGDALDRRGEAAWIEPGPFPGAYHARRRILRDLSVSVIIPFRDSAPLLRSCVDSLASGAGHDRFEIVLVDNDSSDPETLALIDMLVRRPNVRCVRRPGPFNWSVINNAAAATCSSDVLLFLNDDIEAGGGGWMAAMLEHAQRPEVGAVGARLLFPDGSVQHAGVVIGLGALAGHLFHDMPAGEVGYMAWASLTREWSAVTGACMMCRTAVFREMGGFDESYAVGFNDVDFCLRLREAGYRVLYTPNAELVHFESKTRGMFGYGTDHERFLRRWADMLRAGDPLFSRNLSRLSLHCVARPADEDQRWEENSGLTSLSPS